MPIVLENVSKQIKTFPISAEVAKELGDSWPSTKRTVTVMQEDPRTGQRRPRTVTRSFPEPLTLLAGQKSQALPDALLKVRQIQAARDSRPAQIRVLSSGAAAAPAASPPKGDKSKVKQKENERTRD